MIATYKSSLEINRNQLEDFQEYSNIQPNLSSKNNLSLEIDRLFICVNQGAKAVSMLNQLGLFCPG